MVRTEGTVATCCRVIGFDGLFHHIVLAWDLVVEDDAIDYISLHNSEWHFPKVDPGACLDSKPQKRAVVISVNTYLAVLNQLVSSLCASSKLQMSSDNFQILRVGKTERSGSQTD